MAETLVIELKEGASPSPPSAVPASPSPSGGRLPPLPVASSPTEAAPSFAGDALDIPGLLAQVGQVQAAQVTRLVQQAQQVFQAGQMMIQASPRAATASVGRAAAGAGSVGAAAGGTTVAGAVGAGAGAGAGAATGLAAAAGPAGLAIAGAMLIDQLEKETEKQQREAVRKFVEHVGAAGKALASLSLQPLEEKIDATIRRFGVLGEALGETRKQFGEFTAALSQTARRLAPFSAPLAQADAMAEVRQTLGDIRRGQLLGPEMARFIDAQSRIEQAKQNITARLLQPFLGPAANVQEKLADVLERIEAVLDRMLGFPSREDALREILNASSLPPGVPPVPFAPPPRGGRG